MPSPRKIFCVYKQAYPEFKYEPSLESVWEYLGDAENAITQLKQEYPDYRITLAELYINSPSIYSPDT